MDSHQTDAPAMVQLGRHQVPENWPVTGEPSRSFRDKLRSGFFAAYMAGDVIIDVGYRGGFADAVPILPHAVGVDLDFPGYDGIRLPFADGSVDTVHASHTLEHVDDYRAVIRDWYRALRCGGFIVCAVPHQFLYEKRRTLPSLWNPDHKRFYTPASLLQEFEESLAPNSYRIRHLRDADDNYTYQVGPESHAGGGYEIELVVEKIDPPVWELAGSPERDADQLARSAAAQEAAAGAAEAERWFDAAIIALAEEIGQARTSRRSRWQRLRRRVAPSDAGSLARAERASDAQQWERAARFYVDALLLDPRDRGLWERLGGALDRAGRSEAALLAYRWGAER